MKALNYFLFCACICFSFFIYGETHFGYISYSSSNIGDDIQAIAAKRFLPENAIPIDREYTHTFEHAGHVATIINGWFMHTKTSWVRDGIPPEKSWPPSSYIEPFFISLHLDPNFLPEALSDEGIEYLKQHGPVGARDYYTLRELQKREIPSYFSGCLSLTLENTPQPRNDIIYAVDLEKELVDYIQSQTTSRVISITHGMFYSSFNNTQRLKFAEKILDKYRRAKCVVTSRLHVCMPCLAFETPVLLLVDHVDQRNPRFDGLGALTRHCSEKQLLNGEADFDFTTPPENPKDYIPIRENLIKTVEAWVEAQNFRN